jgi:hypothetical protein
MGCARHERILAIRVEHASSHFIHPFGGLFIRHAFSSAVLSLLSGRVLQFDQGIVVGVY